jgi:hypothetical protein
MSNQKELIIMGQCYDFTCASCGYNATVSGGDDRGMRCATTTIICHDCEELFDVTIFDATWDDATDLSDAPIVCPGRAPDDELEDGDEEDEDDVDYSNPTHKVERWSHPGPCPRCGDTLEAGDCVILWD